MKVFLDSSVIITGIHSKTSASNIILDLSRKRKIKAFISKLIINEVIRNLHKKFPKSILQEFLQYLPQSNFKKIEFKSESEVLKFQGITSQKDLHVIAAAVKAGADYLVTLDQKHLLSLKKHDFSFVILSPGDFIKVLASKT